MAKVLHVSDIAGVGASLRSALEAHTPWSTASVDLPDTAAGSGRILHGFGVAVRALRTPYVVRRALVDQEPDVVHLHWARFAPLMPSTARPLVVHAHGSDVRDRVGGAGGRIVRRALDRADAVIASTPDLLEFLPAGAQVLPSPIDVNFFAPAPIAGAGTDRPVVLIFARLTEIKGGQMLVEFARHLLRRRPDVEVRAFRGGRFDAEAQAAGVRMLDAADRAGVRRHILDADVVIGQQRLGVLGLSELEALSCGRPVIASLNAQFRHPDLPIVATSTADQIVGECEELLDSDHQRLSLGVEGRSYVTRNHHPTLIAGQLSALYDDVC